MIRTKLKFSIDEWEALPWWQQKVYIKGLEWDAEENEKASGDGGGSERTSESDITDYDAFDNTFGEAQRERFRK